MSAAEMARRLAAAGDAAAAAAEVRAGRELAARAADLLADSDVGVTETADGAVALTGRALRIRALGSRRRAPDARFAGLLATLARGEGR